MVLVQAFGQPAFPVDTHIHRLAQRWGLTSGKNVEQTEADLKALFPEPTWHSLHLQIIFFGRDHCGAQKHAPSTCPICAWAAVAPYTAPKLSPLKAGQGISHRPDLVTALQRSPVTSPARRLLQLAKDSEEGGGGGEGEAAAAGSRARGAGAGEGSGGDVPAAKRRRTSGGGRVAGNLSQ